MQNTSARRALTGSAWALLLACVSLAALLPQLAAGTVGSPLRALAAGLGVLLAMPLHWRWLAAGARQLGLPVRGWLALSVVLFPLGGAAALILLLGLAGRPHRLALPTP